MLKLIITSILIITNFNCFAASTTAKPFSFEFFTEGSPLDIKAELLQACRYEKFVIGDSAEFETNYKKITLDTESSSKGSLTRHVIEHSNTEVMKLDGIFKYGKECMSMLTVVIADKTYSIGWGGQYSKPITFKLDTGFYRYKEGDSRFDPYEVSSKIENSVLSFLYKKAGTVQYNIWLLKDDVRMSDIMPTTAAMNDKTGKPYLLRK